MKILGIIATIVVALLGIGVGRYVSRAKGAPTYRTAFTLERQTTVYDANGHAVLSYLTTHQQASNGNYRATTNYNGRTETLYGEVGKGVVLITPEKTTWKGNYDHLEAFDASVVRASSGFEGTDTVAGVECLKVHNPNVPTVSFCLAPSLDGFNLRIISRASDGRIGMIAEASSVVVGEPQFARPEGLNFEAVQR